jgi:hypothetical protein
MAASGTYGPTRVCAGIVGHADLPLGAPVEKVLEAMIAAGGGRFRGIRFITASYPDQAAWGSAVIRPAGLLMDRKVREGFARLAPLGLSRLRKKWSRPHSRHFGRSESEEPESSKPLNQLDSRLRGNDA